MNQEKHPFVAVSPSGAKRQHILKPGVQIVGKKGLALLVGWTQCGRKVGGWEMGVFTDGNLCAQCLSRRR